MIRIADFKPGVTLFNEGDEGELFYTIMEGTVEVLKQIEVQLYDFE